MSRGDVEFNDLKLEPLWYFMNERHRIWRRRFVDGEPFPWTKDPILREYKFTNVFRELDAVTLALHERMDPVASTTQPYDRMYEIVLFRAFNWPATYDRLVHHGATRNFHKMMAVLMGMTKTKQKIFTGAYIITNAGSKKPKIRLMTSAMEAIFRDRKKIWRRIEDDGSMKGATEILAEYPMMGMFTGYEVVCDLRHQKNLIKFSDVRTWANLGPGARRGINRLVSGKQYPNVYSRKTTYEEFMRAALQMAPAALDKNVFKEAVPIEMREIEHCLCETDKYLRVKLGEGRPRSRYRGGVS